MFSRQEYEAFLERKEREEWEARERLEKQIKNRENRLLLPNEFARLMKAISEDGDTEIAHSLADKLLCEALQSLGYGEGVEIFRKMHKWYA